MTGNKLVDKDGNTLLQDGVNVFLILSGEKKRRRIGWLDFRVGGNEFHTARSVNTHTFKAEGSFGFNWHLMKNGNFDTVFVHTDDGRDLKVSREAVLKCPVRKFAGSELQFFVPLGAFEGARGV